MNYMNGSYIMCYITLIIKYVPELQEWILHTLLYHIDHKSVAEVHEWFLHHVIYHIDHKAVPGPPEWFLHNMILCCEHLER
jgi:hypothetical protein